MNSFELSRQALASSYRLLASGRIRQWRSCTRITFFAAALMFPAAALAFPQWQWFYGTSTGPFANKREAQAYANAQSPQNALRTIETQGSMTASQVTYIYTGPMKPPEIQSAWRYVHTNWSASVSSESEMVTIRTAELGAGVHPSCPKPVLVPNGAWVMTHSFRGVVSTTERRDYLITNKYGYAANSTPHCFLMADSVESGFRRSRDVGCPQYYSSTSIAPHCELPGSYVLTRRPIPCSAEQAAPSTVGNPCDVATGAKTQVEVDYVGNGLSFSRTYQSVALEESGVGNGWTHNYDKRVVLNVSTPTALKRGDGYDHRVQTLGGNVNYLSSEGAGLLVKKGTTDIKVYRGDGTIETYSLSGLLLSINERGRVTTFAYAVGGKVASVTGPFGHTIVFQYTNGTGALERLITPSGEFINYSYGANGNLVSVAYPDGTTKTYHYEDPNEPKLLTGVTDEASNRYSTFAYDATGRAISTEHAGGTQRFSLSYGTTSTTVTDPLGLSLTYTIPDSSYTRRITAFSRGGLTRSVVLANPTQDFQRRVTQRTDERGIITKYTYSTYALTQKTEAFGTPRARTTSYQYLNNDSDLPTLITEPNRTTAFTYDSLGNWLTKTVTNTATGATRVWTRTIDSYGRVLTENGPRTDVSDVTTYTYHTCTTGYQCGQLATVTNALSQVTTYTSYNAHGQPLSITDPNGVVTTLTYDLRQRLTSRTTSGEATTLEYWPNGLLKKVIQPDASFILYTYDAAQRLIRFEDNLGNRVDYTLDNMGNRTAENVRDPSSSLRRTHSQVFNTLNQLWKDVNAAGTAAVTTVFSYDANGNPTSTAAPLSRTTTNAYDELNRLSQVTDPATGITQFGYDANDNLTSVLDPKGLTTTYTYNGFGDQLTLISPDTGTTINTYDSAGNLSTSTDARSAVATYSYDSTNRVTQVAYGDQTIAYGYDAGTNGKGRLTSASDALHSMSWTYDSLGRVTGKGQTVGGTTLSIGYGYSSGRLVNTTLPSGQVLSYSYNSAGQITGISVGATTILSGALYEPFGPIRQWTWGNSTLAVRTYDTDYKVTQIDSGGFKTLGYDDAFRITSIADGSDPNRSWTYGYDNLDRISSATSTPTTRGWTYDANGNRLTETGSAPSTFTYTVSPSSNRIASISGSLPRTYGYDAAGNTTGFAAASFTYNNRGRMATATYAGTTANYVYNALGQRIRRIVPSATTLYVYDEAGHIVGEYTSAGALIQETVWMGDIPIATLRPKVGGGVDVFYVHTDHLDTPRVITQPSNNAERWRWDSDPFGTDLANENPSGAGTFVYNLRFPGQQFDGLVGMHYNYFRDYDASTGRYFESDPIGLDGGINTYSYALQNPIRNTDPTGEFVPAVIPVVQGAITVVGGAIVAYNAWKHRNQASPNSSENSTSRRGDDCGPDCKELKRGVDRVYRAYQRYKNGPLPEPFVLTRYLKEFEAARADYEQQCGPYQPPISYDTNHDYYRR